MPLLLLAQDGAPLRGQLEAGEFWFLLRADRPPARLVFFCLSWE